MGLSSLELTLLYLLVAVLGVAACRWAKLPPILGYLLAGVAMEPHTLGLALGQDAEGIRQLGEYGVVFLMFVIGLEFNLPKLRAMHRHVFGLGLAQVVLTMALVTAGSLLLAWLAPAAWPLNWQTSVALAGAMAMSSTAIVVKMIADRLELDSEHGQRVMGVLLFQDLAVVPLLVLIPALGSSPDQLLEAVGFAMLKATVLVTLLLVGGQRVMRWWLTLVARRRSEELFMLNLLLITLGLAWLTELAGLSLALGAFIAGMLVSETEYKHQVETDIRPFHDVLLGLFFITIGMMLDWHIVLERWALVLALLVLPLLLKLALITLLARGLGATMGVSLRTGLYLAQAGEFGFVLLSLSMFGWYELQLPAVLQNRLNDASGRLQGGRFFGVFLMGGLSALVVGPCVAAPLAGALVFISQTKNVVIGGLALCVSAYALKAILLLSFAIWVEWVGADHTAIGRLCHLMEGLGRVFQQPVPIMQKRPNMHVTPVS